MLVHEDAGDRLQVADLVRAQLTPIGLEGEVAHQPVWSPDGTRLAYRTGDQLLVHGDGAPRDVALASGIELEAVHPYAFSPDGRRLAVALHGGIAVAAITAAGPAPAAPLAAYPGRQVRDLRWSPDGATLVALVGDRSDPAQPSGAAQLAWIPMAGGAPRVVDAHGTVRLLGWRRGRELLTVQTADGHERLGSATALDPPGRAPSLSLPAPQGGNELNVLDYAETPDRLLLVPGGDPDDNVTVLLASPGGATVPWLAAHPQLSELQLTADGAWAVFIDQASGGERPGGSVYAVRVGSDDPRLVLPASAARSFSAPMPRPMPLSGSTPSP